MPKKIRVHELAKELGLSNPETLEILKDLKIDAKSHSSSIEDAQADRARRKADAEGLRREVIPEPPKAKKESKAAEPEAAPSAEPAAPTEAPKARKVVSARSSAAPAPAPATPRVAAPRPPSAEAPSAPARPAAVAPDLGAKPAPAAAARPAAARPAAAGPDLGAKPAPRPATPGEAEGESPTASSEGGEAPKPPTSASGAPIPPPPRRPVSASGRPIPPPPGQGGRRPSPPARPGGRPGGPGGRPGGPGGTGGPGAGRPSGPGAGRPGAPMGAPGMGGPPPGAGRGGMPQGRRPPQRRAKRRRRVVEELEPTQMTTYVPSNAPVPEGEIVVERGSTARDLGPKLNRSAGDVVRFLLLQGEMVTANQSLSDDMIELFAVELGAEIRMVDPGEEQEAELLAKYFEDDDETDDGEQLPRAPVVTVMGHVDHGKTLLLDRIRSADVVSGEAGGITQHVGAYQVNWNGHPITFIDTPGHEAFTAMRARGAKVTDIVILVVAADDGVMPQTIEAIAHAKAAEVPIIVAVNKMDRPDANPDRVLQQIAEHELVPEKWGGDTICVEISALQQTGIQELLEQVVLVAEIAELTASLEGNGRGAVLEANLEVGRGPVATVIVQSGIIKVGDAIVAGAAWGKVKALINDRGEAIKQAGPSTPVQILGFSEPPLAGDEVRVASDQARARNLGEARAHRFRLSGYVPAAATAGGARLEDIFAQIQRGETATLNVVLKADVQGSLEACTESLKKLERDEVKLSFVHRGIGGITENDVQLAKASMATIIGFGVRPDRRSRDLAANEHVEVRTYEIIYKLIEDIESAMLGLLAPTYEEVVTGEAEVRQVFRVPKLGAIAGCYVLNGQITRGSKVRFLREGTIIWKGAISSLRRFKDDVREVASGFECGIGLTEFQDLKDGDIIETYEEREIPRS